MRQDVQEFIDSLSRDEQKEIKDYIDFRVNGIKDVNALSESERLVSESIMAALRSYGFQAGDPAGAVRLYGIQKFRVGCLVFEELIETGVKNVALNKVQRQHLIQTIASLHTKALAEQGRARVTFANIMDNLHYLYESVDKAYPGYVRAGMLAAIVRGNKL